MTLILPFDTENIIYVPFFFVLYPPPCRRFIANKVADTTGWVSGCSTVVWRAQAAKWWPNRWGWHLSSHRETIKKKRKNVFSPWWELLGFPTYFLNNCPTHFQMYRCSNLSIHTHRSFFLYSVFLCWYTWSPLPPWDQANIYLPIF